MRDGYKWAVIYTTLALIFVVAGYIKQIEGFLYGYTSNDNKFLLDV
jgi:hypothetical protein